MKKFNSQQKNKNKNLPNYTKEKNHYNTSCREKLPNSTKDFEVYCDGNIRDLIATTLTLLSRRKLDFEDPL